MAKIRVLIVDDSALMRQLLREILSSDPGIEVVGASSDPIVARAAIDRLEPDVITLDVEMPKMDGLSFLEHLMRVRPIPVVMVSSLTERGCEVTLRALELGAVDFVSKPKIDIARGTADLGTEIIAKVKAAARARVRGPAKPRTGIATEAGGAPKRPSHPPLSAVRLTHRLVAIGASTGGTEALAEVLTALPADAPPIVIVQHMPPVFTRQFAARLDGICRIRVREAADGDVVMPGHALIAPGGLTHMEVTRSGAQFVVRLINTPPLNHHRPAVDILFASVAKNIGANAVGVILTGMGADGARGLLAMRNAGARTIAQDEATCVVFGMPKEAIACGAAEHISPLDRVAGALMRFVRETSRTPHANDAR